MKPFPTFNCLRPNQLKTIFLLAFISQLTICMAQPLSLSNFTWDGQTFNKETSVGSPYDSIVQVNNFKWTDDTVATKNFYRQLAKVYSKQFNMERIIETNRVVYRYVIRNGEDEFFVLEKTQSPSLMEFYFRNGLAVHEIRFYKHLSSYFRDSYD